MPDQKEHADSTEESKSCSFASKDNSRKFFQSVAERVRKMEALGQSRDEFPAREGSRLFGRWLRR